MYLGSDTGSRYIRVGYVQILDISGLGIGSRCIRVGYRFYTYLGLNTGSRGIRVGYRF